MATIKPIQMSVVVSPRDLDYIDQQIRNGTALNRSDFVRAAIRRYELTQGARPE